MFLMSSPDWNQLCPVSTMRTWLNRAPATLPAHQHETRFACVCCTSHAVYMACNACCRLQVQGSRGHWQIVSLAPWASQAMNRKPTHRLCCHCHSHHLLAPTPLSSASRALSRQSPGLIALAASPAALRWDLARLSAARMRPLPSAKAGRCYPTGRTYSLRRCRWSARQPTAGAEAPLPSQGATALSWHSKTY